MLPKISYHANLRFNERFPELNIVDEWNNALPVSKAILQRIRRACSKNLDKMSGDGLRFYRYFLSKRGVVFVYDTTGVIITVFPVRNIEHMDIIFRKGRAYYQTGRGETKNEKPRTEPATIVSQIPLDLLQQRILAAQKQQELQGGIGEEQN